MNQQIPRFLEAFNAKEVGLEASTHIAPIYRSLDKKGYDVSVSYPKEAKSIAKQRIKTDRKDSKTIAELLRLDALPLSEPCEHKTDKLSSHRRSLWLKGHIEPNRTSNNADSARQCYTNYKTAHDG